MSPEPARSGCQVVPSFEVQVVACPARLPTATQCPPARATSVTVPPVPRPRPSASRSRNCRRNSLNGAYLQVEGAPLDQSGIRNLYESQEFPLPRRPRAPEPAPAGDKADTEAA